MSLLKNGNLRHELTPEERMRGSRPSIKKRWSAQLRELKKKGLTNENYHKIIAIMEEPEASALDIFTFIQSIKADCKNANQKVLVADSLIRWHKAHHGEKIKTENIHYVSPLRELIRQAVIKRKKENLEQETININSEQEQKEDINYQ